MHRYGWLAWVGLLAVLVTAPAAKADLALPFTETFNTETTGDDASELTWWAYEPAYGSAPAADAVIVDVGGGDKVFDMNPGATDSMGVRSDRATFGPVLFWVETDMLLTSDGNGAGVVGFSQNTETLNGYVLAVSRDGSGGAWLDLRRFDGDLDDSFTVGPVHVTDLDPTDVHRYRLEADFGTAGQIGFAVRVDGQLQTDPNLTPVDTDPHDVSDGVRGVLAANGGQQVYFDNVNITPEPATLVLLTLGGVALAARRRRVT